MHQRRNARESLWTWRANKLLEALQTYIARNRASVINYAARYRAGQRIATSPAEARVNRLVAKRFVKKQQIRWSRTGAHYLLKVRAAVLNGNFSNRTRYATPPNPVPGRIAALLEPTPPPLKAT